MVRLAADLLLSGHVHESRVVSQWSPQGACIEIVAGSIYDGDALTSNSYNYVCFDTESKFGHVYLRRFCPDAAQGPEWQRDLASTGEDANGVVEIQLRDSTSTSSNAIDEPLQDDQASLRCSFLEMQKAELNRRPLLAESHADRDSVAVLFPNVYVDPLVFPKRHPLGQPLPLSQWMEEHWEARHRILLSCLELI